MQKIELQKNFVDRNSPTNSMMQFGVETNAAINLLSSAKMPAKVTALSGKGLGPESYSIHFKGNSVMKLSPKRNGLSIS